MKFGNPEIPVPTPTQRAHLAELALGQAVEALIQCKDALRKDHPARRQAEEFLECLNEEYNMPALLGHEGLGLS